MTQHPSGRPVRIQIVKAYSQVRWPLDGFVTVRLNTVERAGGFGFRLPPEPDDPMHHETRASKLRPK